MNSENTFSRTGVTYTRLRMCVRAVSPKALSDLVCVRGTKCVSADKNVCPGDKMCVRRIQVRVRRSCRNVSQNVCPHSPPPKVISTCVCPGIKKNSVPALADIPFEAGRTPESHCLFCLLVMPPFVSKLCRDRPGFVSAIAGVVSPPFWTYVCWGPKHCRSPPARHELIVSPERPRGRL